MIRAKVVSEVNGVLIAQTVIISIVDSANGVLYPWIDSEAHLVDVVIAVFCPIRFHLSDQSQTGPSLRHSELLSENSANADFSSFPDLQSQRLFAILLARQLPIFFEKSPRNKMFKIEKTFEGDSTVLRLVGRVKAEHLAELETLIRDVQAPVHLDLSEVTLVDLDVVCFLGDNELHGVRLVNCSPYVREWIHREKAANSSQRK